MKFNFSNFFNIWFLWGICFTINSIAFLFVYYKINPSSKTLALHYNVLVGVDLYGKGLNLYSIPALAFFLSIVNLIFFKALKNDKSFLAFLSLVATTCIQLILFLALLFLAKVN